MTCQKCNSVRTANVYAKCSDLFNGTFRINESQTINHEGYVPHDCEIGNDGDGIELEYCLECGQIQGIWPQPGPTNNDDD